MIRRMEGKNGRRPRMMLTHRIIYKAMLIGSIKMWKNWCRTETIVDVRDPNLPDDRVPPQKSYTIIRNVVVIFLLYAVNTFTRYVEYITLDASSHDPINHSGWLVIGDLQWWWWCSEASLTEYISVIDLDISFHAMWSNFRSVVAPSIGDWEWHIRLQNCMQDTGLDRYITRTHTHTHTAQY